MSDLSSVRSVLSEIADQHISLEDRDELLDDPETIELCLCYNRMHCAAMISDESDRWELLEEISAIIERKIETVDAERDLDLDLDLDNDLNRGDGIETDGGINSEPIQRSTRENISSTVTIVEDLRPTRDGGSCSHCNRDYRGRPFDHDERGRRVLAEIEPGVVEPVNLCPECWEGSR
jgi:hypothetical protein